MLGPWCAPFHAPHRNEVHPFSLYQYDSHVTFRKLITIGYKSYLERDKMTQDYRLRSPAVIRHHQIV